MKDVNELGVVSVEEAKELYEISKGIESSESYIKAVQKVYSAIAEGHKILDVYEAFTVTGTDEHGLPKLAIARADRKKIYLTSQGNFQYRALRNVKTSWGTSMRWTSKMDVSLPKGTFPLLKSMGDKRYSTRVPIIPVKFYPKDDLKRYFVLWEVESWDEEELMPEDPFLLKRLTKNLFMIMAEWDLTPLEKAIMKGL